MLPAAAHASFLYRPPAPAPANRAAASILRLLRDHCDGAAVAPAGDAAVEAFAVVVAAPSAPASSSVAAAQQSDGGYQRMQKVLLDLLQGQLFVRIDGEKAKLHPTGRSLTSRCSNLGVSHGPAA